MDGHLEHVLDFRDPAACLNRDGLVLASMYCCKENPGEWTEEWEAPRICDRGDGATPDKQFGLFVFQTNLRFTAVV